MPVSESSSLIAVFFAVITWMLLVFWGNTGSFFRSIKKLSMVGIRGVMGGCHSSGRKGSVVEGPVEWFLQKSMIWSRSILISRSN